MKLKHDLIRDLMIYFEENLTMDNSIDVLSLELEGYESDDIIYTAKKLYEAGYIKGNPKYASNKLYWFPVLDITVSGHAFLKNIEDPKVYEEATKTLMSKVSSFSIDILNQVAAAIIASKIGL